MGGFALWPFKVVQGAQDHFLVFYRKYKIPDEHIFSQRATDFRYALVGYDAAIRRGSDGFFIGCSDGTASAATSRASSSSATSSATGDAAAATITASSSDNEQRSCEFLILAENGESVESIRATCDANKVTQYEATTFALGQTYHRVFAAPMANGRAALFYDAASKVLVRSANSLDANIANPYAIDTSVRLQLAPFNMVTDVVWSPAIANRAPSFGAVITTHSILIIDQHLRVITHTRVDNHLPRAHFFSCYWVGATLLFTTDTQLRYLTLDGRVHSIASLPGSGMLISCVWDDRVALAYANQSHLDMVFQPIGLLEPLLLGELALATHLGTSMQAPELRKALCDIVANYDCTRISRYLVDRLQQGGFADLALALIRASPLYPTRFKLNLALESAQFRTAFSILMQERELPHPDISPAEVSDMFRILGDACCKFALFQLAEKCYQQSDSQVLLLQLYALHKAMAKLTSVDEPQYANALMHLLQDSV
jgi:hypothetical protein